MGQATLLGSVRENPQSPFVGSVVDEVRVLVVEDDEAMRAFLDESLREEGYRVRSASNTLSGIVTLLGEPIDVMVVDWKMPDLDGFALLSAVRRCFADVPVIFVTAFASPDIARRALEEGAFSFLPKPFRLSVLVAEIERALKIRPSPGLPRADAADHSTTSPAGTTPPRVARRKKREGPITRSGPIATE